MLVTEMTFLRDHWYPVAETATVDGPRTIRLFGSNYVLWPTGDGGFAMSDPFCPHRSADLAGGWVDDGALVCAYHGWRFDGDGQCTHIPQLTPGVPTPPRAQLRTYPAVERYGVVWTCVGEPESAEPPTWVEGEEAADGRWRLFVEFFEPWQVSAPRIIDNNLDSSHVAYVHHGTFGDPDDALLPPIDVEPTDPGGFRSLLVTAQPGIGVQLGVTTDESQRFERTTETEVLAPLTTRTRMYYNGLAPTTASSARPRRSTTTVRSTCGSWPCRGRSPNSRGIASMTSVSG